MGRDADVRCLRLAALQAGVVRRKQALECGLTARRIALRVLTGRWEELFPTVYRVEGTPRSWRQTLRAACLWAEEGFAVSHFAAARLWGFSRFTAEPVELSVINRTHPPAGLILHQPVQLLARDLASIDGLRVTSATRTLLDVGRRVRFQDLRATIDEALRRKVTTLPRLERALIDAEGRHGTGNLREIVEELAGGRAVTESELEARVLDLIDDHGLPRPTTQKRVFAGGRLRRLDFFYPERRLVIEAEGYAHHSGFDVFEADRDRGNWLSSRGFRVLRWTWKGVTERPHELAAQLAAHLVMAA